MTKRRSTKSDDVQLDQAADVSEEEVKSTDQAKESAAKSAARAAETVSLKSVWPGRLIVNEDETLSGRRYVFERAGAIVDVLVEDAEILLARKSGPVGCCGSERQWRRYVVEA